SSRESSATHRRPSLSINRYRSAPDRVFTRQDIDEVLALHTRSCHLFQSFSVPPSAPQSPGLSSIGSRYSIDIPRVNIDATAPGQLSRTTTTMHWTSPSTRRREYAEIDRSTRGLRGLVRRLTPKCFSTRHLQPFYDEKAARSDDDTASVRRYRIDLPDEEGDDEKRGHEMSVRPSTAP
ncbi:hypothetical protein IWX90DRAFT_358412, partial [Phyllosticta citrichinensis]